MLLVSGVCVRRIYFHSAQSSEKSGWPGLADFGMLRRISVPIQDATVTRVCKYLVRDKVGTVADTVILPRRISYRRITPIRTVLRTFCLYLASIVDCAKGARVAQCLEDDNSYVRHPLLMC